MPLYLKMIIVIYLGIVALVYIAILWIYIKCEIIEGTKSLWWRINDISFGLLVLGLMVSIIWPIWFFSLFGTIILDQLAYIMRTKGGNP